MLKVAPQIHREFLLNVHFFQRQITYHQRYVSYLINHAQDTRHIYPTRFKSEMSQENDALMVLNSRLKAVIDHTTAALEMVSDMQHRPKISRADNKLKDIELDQHQTSSALRRYSQAATSRRCALLFPRTNSKESDNTECTLSTTIICCGKQTDFLWETLLCTDTWRRLCTA